MVGASRTSVADGGDSGGPVCPAEHAIELGRDHHVAEPAEERDTLWPAGKGLGSRRTALDEHALDRHAMHLRVCA
jgi:hypothetical protein